jgi:hypothetical protein
VKLMGRHAGFITAGAVVVGQHVNFALILEVPFAWEHLNLLGEYDFSETSFRIRSESSPQNYRLNQVPSWEFRNRRKSFTPRQLAGILWDFTYLCWANPGMR